MRRSMSIISCGRDEAEEAEEAEEVADWADEEHVPRPERRAPPRDRRPGLGVAISEPARW